MILMKGSFTSFCSVHLRNFIYILEIHHLIDKEGLTDMSLFVREKGFYKSFSG